MLVIKFIYFAAMKEKNIDFPSRTSDLLTRQSRRKIHSTVKFLAYTNDLPIEYANQLHKSQLSRYKNHLNETAYFGSDLSNIEKSVLKQFRQLNEHSFDRKTVNGYLKLASVFRTAFSGSAHYNSTLKKQHEKFVDVIQAYKCVIPVAKFARILKISESTVRNWIREVRVKCSGTITNLCRKEHPNQLLSTEVDAMKNLLISEDKIYWPLVSVYYFALNNNIVSMGLSTWYKYVGLLGINRPKPKSVKHYGKSIVGQYPNQYWHADVTQFRTLDGVLHYIYLVIDNYSKNILSWRVSTKLCKDIRLETFKESIKTALLSFTKLDLINLIVDGGSENNNKTVDDFIRGLTDVNFVKEVALKTVHFSNSMIEATNRILKTYYLNQKELNDTDALEKRLEWAINDLCSIRPHGQLNGLTPELAYHGCKPDTDQHKEQKATSRLMRIETNLNLPCCKV